MEEPEIMTVEEVSAYLRVSERTVYEWAQKGQLPCGKLGSTWRFRRNDIMQWINQRLGQGNSSPLPERETTLRGLLNINNILLLEPGNKAAALNQLIDLMSNNTEVTDAAALRKAIFRREELMSTGIGMGIGVPHIRLESIRDIVLAVGISKVPISDYGSLDNIPVSFIFMIAAAKNQHAEHIRLLSSISFQCKNEALRAKLLNAKDRQEIFNILAGP